jgi:peptidoglycan hydrolase-like protein with peptidoglycan-binding domain
MAEPLRAPRRKAPAKKNGPAYRGAFAALLGGSLRALFRQPAMSAAMLVFGGLGIATIVNALALQGNRHPAPLFADVSDPKATRSTAPKKPAAMQAPRASGFSGQVAGAATADDASDPFILDLQNELARRGLYTGAIDGKSGARTEAAIRTYEAHVGLPVTGAPSPLILRKLAAASEAAQPSVDVDPLRGVIQASTPPAPEDLETFIKVQKALNKAGFGPLSEDGVIGAATRDAIERFERSRKLPPTGSATGRTLKALLRAGNVAAR